MHLVQLSHSGLGRRVAVVEGDNLRLLQVSDSVYAAALSAMFVRAPLAEQIHAELSDEVHPYEEIYRGDSEWKILPPLDHPDDPARCLVTGTGLTHRKGAANRKRHAPDRSQCRADCDRQYANLSVGRRRRQTGNGTN